MGNRTTETNGHGDVWDGGVWAAGEYARAATQYLPMAARLADAVGIDANDQVLDIGTGTGNLAITAARRGADVTGVDICEELLKQARERTQTYQVDNIVLDAGDAADLPFSDDTFDVVVSNLGHMYADPPSTVARELIRVTRPGGRIGFTSWTPMSLYPRMAGAAIGHVPPSALPDYSEPPFMWGDETTVRDRLGELVVGLSATTADIGYPAVGPEAFWEETKQTSGMFRKLLTSLDEETKAELESEMIAVISSAFDSTENIVPLSYLQTTATVPDR